MEAVSTGGRVLVLGAASGIGAACAQALAASGWEVVAGDMAAIASGSVVTDSEVFDVRDADAVEAGIGRLAQAGPFDALVNAAGLARVAPLDEITSRAWQLLIDVNLTGHSTCSARPHRGCPDGSSIVMISSVDSTLPVSGLGHYCASKAGVDALMRSAALEFGPRGIRCNVVAPGVVRTPLMAPYLDRPEISDSFTSRTPLGRLGSPEDIADVVTFLVSPAARVDQRRPHPRRRRPQPARAPLDAGATGKYPARKDSHMSTDQQTKVSVDVGRCEQLLTEIVRIRSVVGEATTAHLWVSDRLRELGMTVEHYAVEGRKAPLVLGVLEGDGDGPGVLFDAHYDTVHAVAGDWEHDPWGAEVVDGVLYGRGAVDSKGTHVAMLAALEQVLRTGRPRSGPIYFMSDSDGEDGFRGAVLMADLGVSDRVGTIFSAEATSNTGIEIAYPGISTWKVTAVGRTAHPTEPENGINAVTKMAKLVQAVDAGKLETPRGTSSWFAPRVTVQAIRTLPGGGWTIPGRCDAVLSVLSPAGTTLTEVRDSISAFLRALEHEDGEVRFELQGPADGSREAMATARGERPRRTRGQGHGAGRRRRPRDPGAGAEVQRRLGRCR